MGYRYDAGNRKPGNNRQPVPKGKYLLRIIDAKEGYTKTNGDYKVTVDYRIAAGEHEKRMIRFHNVVFFAPDHEMAGMALHYLKCIGQPYSEAFEIEPEMWIGNLLWGDVVVNQRGYNEVKGVEKFTEGETEPPAARPETPAVSVAEEEPPADEEAPF